MSGKSVFLDNRHTEIAKKITSVSSELLVKTQAWVIALHERYKSRKAALELARLSDEMLRDIGITRADVSRLELSKQPEKELRAMNRRAGRMMSSRENAN